MGPKSLTDVAISRPTRPSFEIPLDQVGMENISTRILIADEQGRPQPTKARVHAFVSLDQANARGIHMSRLFKIVNELDQTILNRESLGATLEQMLSTHKDLSRRAYLSVEFESLLKRKALVSGAEGWRSYPIVFLARRENGRNKFQVQITIEYSSTCPCSASLSREALQEKFAADFANQKPNSDDFHNWLGRESSIVAVPHSQRSEAKVILEFADSAPIALAEWIDVLENSVGTPVQAAVKREDEQEFARLNGQNLMFCEDAARKIKASLLTRPELTDFQIEVRHFESLHAHDVVARCSKHN